MAQAKVSFVPYKEIDGRYYPLSFSMKMPSIDKANALERIVLSVADAEKHKQNGGSYTIRIINGTPCYFLWSPAYTMKLRAHRKERIQVALDTQARKFAIAHQNEKINNLAVVASNQSFKITRDGGLYTTKAHTTAKAAEIETHYKNSFITAFKPTYPTINWVGWAMIKSRGEYNKKRGVFSLNNLKTNKFEYVYFIKDGKYKHVKYVPKTIGGSDIKKFIDDSVLAFTQKSNDLKDRRLASKGKFDAAQERRHTLSRAKVGELSVPKGTEINLVFNSASEALKPIYGVLAAAAADSTATYVTGSEDGQYTMVFRHGRKMPVYFIGGRTVVVLKYRAPMIGKVPRVILKNHKYKVAEGVYRPNYMPMRKFKNVFDITVLKNARTKDGKVQTAFVDQPSNSYQTLGNAAEIPTGPQTIKMEKIYGARKTKAVLGGGVGGYSRPVKTEAMENLGGEPPAKRRNIAGTAQEAGFGFNLPTQ
jgi:hypothetical protein